MQKILYKAEYPFPVQEKAWTGSKQSQSHRQTRHSCNLTDFPIHLQSQLPAAKKFVYDPLLSLRGEDLNSI